MHDAIRIRLQQINVVPGHPRRNAGTMLAGIDAARRDGVRLLVFPEMAIPGYLLGDAWERPAFVRECLVWGERIREASRDLAVMFGNLGVDPERRNEDGRIRKYNALYVAENEQFRVPGNGLNYPFIVKTLLPNYRQFDDSRHFYDNRKLAQETNRPLNDLIVPLTIAGCRIGPLICEDAWDADYGVAPASILADKGADLLIDISCSPFTANKHHKRTRVFCELSQRLDCPVLHVNNVGIQDNGKTVYTFDGGTAGFHPTQTMIAGPAPFAEGALTLDWPPTELHGWTPAAPRPDAIAEIDQALVYGINRFRQRLGVERVVVGVSGGIDSAVVAALHRRILDPRDLLLVTMPSRFNSGRTRRLAQDLAASLECLFLEIPIDASVALTRRQLHDVDARSVDGRRVERLCLDDAVMENVQARDRSSRVLAAVAAAFGGVFTCNANKTEMTVGYTTLYGDLGGYLAPIGDLWKGEVYDLARYMNQTIFKRETIPDGSMTVTPSAELSDAQDVEQGLGDPLYYPYHDALFRCWVEAWNRATPEEVLTWYRDGVLEKTIGFDGSVSSLFDTPAAFIADVEHWWRAYQGLAVAKRIQAPPVLAVKRRAFGFDHREAQIGPLFTDAYEEIKQRILLEFERCSR